MSGSIADDLARDNREAIRAFAILSVFFLLVAAGSYLYTASWTASPIPKDGTTLVVGRDFFNIWMYGRTALTPDPGRFYDVVEYNRAIEPLVGPNYPGQNWTNPPALFFFAAPFGLLSYLPALLIWTVLSWLLLFATLRRHFVDKRLLLAAVLAPAAVQCMISGQTALVTATMLVTIFAWLDRRPIAAGILIGLLTFKPQLGILFPIMLIASGRWKVFAAASVTALALAGATLLAFGPQVWIDFVTKALPVQNIVLADPERIATPFQPTVFMNLRGIDLPYRVAMMIQLCFTACAVAAVAWAFRWRRGADPTMLMALFFACTAASSPYFSAYDTLALALSALLLLDQSKLDAAGRRLAQLVYWLPIIQAGLGTLHIPGPGLIAPTFALYVAMRLRASAGAADLPARFITAR